MLFPLMKSDTTAFSIIVTIANNVNLLANWQAGHLYIQMLCSAKPGLRPDLRNRLVGAIPNPRMIANFVVRLSVVSLC